ncbi:MAG TPA: RNA polymerase sigma factor [Dermatophilaceae bacterium]|nr:RNA polymerase sigma factor [Dermatophilaceae bacterium]
MSSNDTEVGSSPDSGAAADWQRDATLVARLQAGDEKAFAEIVSGWSAVMLRVARGHVSTDASAQEVVQDTWLAVIRGLDRFEGRSTLRTWVFAILKNLARTRGAREARAVPWSSLSPSEDTGPAVDERRFRGPDDEWPGHWAPLAGPRRWEPSPEDRAVAEEIRSELSAGIAELPERQRAVVSLRDVHGLSADEVCSLLGLSPGNQRVLLHRARSQLRRRLEVFYLPSGSGAGP